MKAIVRNTLSPTFRRSLMITAATAAVVAGTRPASASLITTLLGSSSNYAVLGLGGTLASHADFEVYQSGTVINGNVGMGPYSDWTHGIDATINGRVDYDITNSAPTVTGFVSGGLHQVPMGGVVADARTASNTAAAFAPTQTFATLTSGQTIVGNGGLNVIRVTGDVGLSGGGTTLNLQGGASDVFIFQLVAADAPSAHTLTLSGVHVNLVGGLTFDNVLWNMNGTGGGIVISSGAVVSGFFLAPGRGIEVDHGNVTGSVIGGGGTDSHSNSVSVHSTSTITMPAPGALCLLALAGLTAGRRRR